MLCPAPAQSWRLAAVLFELTFCLCWFVHNLLRLRRKLEDVRYIATLEIQQRGAYHFHLLLNAPDAQFGLDNVVPLWQSGIVDIVSVDDTKKVLLYIRKTWFTKAEAIPYTPNGVILCHRGWLSPWRSALGTGQRHSFKKFNNCSKVGHLTSIAKWTAQRQDWWSSATTTFQRTSTRPRQWRSSDIFNSMTTPFQEFFMRLSGVSPVSSVVIL